MNRISKYCLKLTNVAYRVTNINLIQDNFKCYYISNKFRKYKLSCNTEKTFIALRISMV